MLRVFFHLEKKIYSKRSYFLLFYWHNETVKYFSGGFCATNNKKLYKKLLLIRNHGVYDNLTDSWCMPGYNLKPTNLQCFIGIDEIRNVGKKEKNILKLMTFI